jgi:hypothetical protein
VQGQVLETNAQVAYVKGQVTSVKREFKALYESLRDDLRIVGEGSPP